MNIWQLRGMLFLTCLCAIGFCRPVNAQQAEGNFIYIQNEAGSPFYVRKGDSLMSSSPAGYIIIPQLSQGDYHLTIGFPGNQAPEASFAVQVDGSDKGYMLRKAGPGFALYALRDFKKLEPQAVASAPGNRIVQMPVSPEAAEPKPVESQAQALPADQGQDSTGETDAALAASPANPPPSDTDAFSRMLNEITGGNTPPPAPQTPVSSTSREADSQATALAQPPGADPTSPEDTEAAAQPAAEPPAVEQAAVEQSPADTPAAPVPATPDKDLQFIDFSAFSPQSSPASDQAASPIADHPAQVNPPQETAASSAVAPEAEADSSQEEAPDDTGASEVPESTASSDPAGTSGLALANSDCQQQASESDFQKVRRKMASRNDEEGMYRIAEKFLNGGTCYTTSQIQSLTYLFMTDEYKYKFLELAYPHISDTGHFSQLGKTLSSDYYRGRFQAMIK
jgi:hypothetical protein